MDASLLIIVLSLSVLVSYVFDLLSSRFRTPSVVLLLATGLILRQVLDYAGVQVPLVGPTLATLGTIGLILIVLEGALDLDAEPTKRRLIQRTFASASLTIIVTTGLIAGTLYLLLDEPLYKCLINAVPFAVISSAVAIPTAPTLTADQREFAVYESSFSDIFGVLTLNFLLLAQTSFLNATLLLGRDLLVTAVVSVAACFGLLYLIGRINHPVKFLPIVSVLLLIYAVANTYGLSSLLVVLVFGLFLNNTELFVRGSLAEFFKNDLFERELAQIKNLTTEGAFVIRTFFFLLFGYATNPQALIDTDALIISALFVGTVLAVRAVLLRFTFVGPQSPLRWMAPRGLITVLLYQSIPANLKLTGFPEGTLLLVVLLSSLVLLAGVISAGRSRPDTV
jgi:potassium/hydrogen antiporter